MNLIYSHSGLDRTLCIASAITLHGHFTLYSLLFTLFRIIVHLFHFRRKCFSFMAVMYEGYGFMVACIIHMYGVVAQ
jgi:hypothetical protein